MSAATQTETGEGWAMAAYRRYRPARRISPTLAFAPDGLSVAYVDDGTGQFNVTTHEIGAVDGTTLTSFVDETVRRVAWHPDGDSLFLEADTGGAENTQLYRIDRAGGAPTALTQSAQSRFVLASGNPFSGDGTQIAYSATGQAYPGFNTFVMDVRSGESRCIYDGGGRTYAAHWSPDGTRLSLAQYQQAYDQAVLVTSVDGTSVRQLSPEGSTASYDIGPWLGDGSGLLVRTDESRDFLGLAVMDADDGHLSWLDTPDWDVETVALSADGRLAVWSVNVDGASRLRARDMETGSDVEMPGLPMGRVTSLIVSDDGERLALVLSTPTRPAGVLIIDVASRDVRWLSNTDAQDMDPAALVEPELVRYESFDGRMIPAYLYRPPAAATQPVGVVISIHGGPTWQERPTYGTGFYQFLVSLGIAVLAPNIRGSVGYGRRYQELVYRDWGGDDLRDIEAAARYLQAQPWVDATRIGLTGGSYGGFMVLSCITRLPEINWAAAHAQFGPTNLVTLARATPPAYRALVAATVGDPDDDFDALIERSPMTYASRVRTPLFVLQGANDIRVPQSESDQFVEALREQDIPVRYDVYPGEGHGFMKTSNQMKSEADAVEFLAAHVA